MMGESHAILGAVATGTILIASGKTPANQGIIPFTLAVGLGAVIALLPDIDSPNTLIRRIFGVGRRQVKNNLRRWQRNNILSNLLNLIRWLISLFLNGLAKILPHRGPTHWLVVALTLCSAMYRLTQWQNWSPLVWQSFMIGYISHLFADGLTKSGIKLFSPFYN